MELGGEAVSYEAVFRFQEYENYDRIFSFRPNDNLDSHISLLKVEAGSYRQSFAFTSIICSTLTFNTPHNACTGRRRGWVPSSL